MPDSKKNELFFLYLFLSFFEFYLDRERDLRLFLDFERSLEFLRDFLEWLFLFLDFESFFFGEGDRCFVVCCFFLDYEWLFETVSFYLRFSFYFSSFWIISNLSNGFLKLKIINKILPLILYCFFFLHHHSMILHLKNLLSTFYIYSKFQLLFKKCQKLMFRPEPRTAMKVFISN